MKQLSELLTKEEKKLLNKIVTEYKDMADVEEQLANYLMLNCVTDDENLTKEGIICETILNKLGNLE